MRTSEEVASAIPSASFDVCEPGSRPQSGSRACRIGRDLRIDLDKLSRFCLVELDPIEDDLLLLAGAVAFADKSLARRPSVAWRRNLHLVVPVSDPTVGEHRHFIESSGIPKARRFQNFTGVASPASGGEPGPVPGTSVMYSSITNVFSAASVADVF